MGHRLYACCIQFIQFINIIKHIAHILLGLLLFLLQLQLCQNTDILYRLICN